MELSPEKKIAGVLAPLFGLRSENDLGIGDVAVLREFIDWAAEIGFKLVQLLPINEMGRNQQIMGLENGTILDNQFQIISLLGKGGMGDRTLQACKQHGCVYLHAIGGAAQVLAECIQRVRNVHLMEKFGAPEAIWEFEVENFPAVVTMDSHGGSLHKEVFASSQAELAKHL